MNGAGKDVAALVHPAREPVERRAADPSVAEAVNHRAGGRCVHVEEPHRREYYAAECPVASLTSEYSAYSPDLPGRIATGASREEVEREMGGRSSFTRTRSVRTARWCRSPARTPRTWDVAARAEAGVGPLA